MEIDKSLAAYHLDEWKRNLKILRGLSDKSIASYERHVVEFLLWLAQNQRLSELSAIVRADVEGFLEHCFYSGNGNQTRGTKLVALQSFFRYLLYKGVVGEDVTAGVPRPKVRQTFVQKFTREEILRLFRAIDIETEKGLRDAAILILGVFCGLRASEILGLRLGDLVSDGHGHLDVQVVDSKHGGSRTVYLWKAPSVIVESWLTVRISHNAKTDDPVMISYRSKNKRRGDSLKYGGLDGWLKELANKAQVNRPRGAIKMHMLRATHASDLRSIKGYDIAAIAERLGHKHISTTDRYIPSRQRIHKEYRSLADYWSDFGNAWKKEG